jgi:hypothetical protein
VGDYETLQDVSRSVGLTREESGVDVLNRDDPASSKSSACGRCLQAPRPGVRRVDRVLD